MINKYTTIFDEVAVMPLEPFLHLFAEPKKMAEKLMEVADRLVADYIAINKSPKMKNNRIAKEIRMPMILHSWPNANGDTDVSEYEMCINTYTFTYQHNHREKIPEIELEDLRVFRTRVNRKKNKA
jgi:hypothetical protein